MSFFCAQKINRSAWLHRFISFMLMILVLLPCQQHSYAEDTLWDSASYSVYYNIFNYQPITSIGRENKKINGIKSKNKLLEYTIPEELLYEDPSFAALMLEADKYIGYPFVYGASNPNEGFDCSGFVSWVFIHSGVYNTGRRGATGLHSLCEEIDSEDIRPGDLVFFHGTMGPEVKGITHVGIYVGNHMMLHAGDPVGFANLEDSKWQECLDCYGRLPFKEE